MWLFFIYVTIGLLLYSFFAYIVLFESEGSIQQKLAYWCLVLILSIVWPIFVVFGILHYQEIKDYING